MENNSVQSQQEQEKLVAEWLLATPGFFERNPDLLTSLELSNTHDGKVVSLQEKQMSLLRSQNRDLNAKLAQMLRFGSENDRTQSLMVAWLEELLLARTEEDASQSITTGLNRLFDIGQVLIIANEKMSDALKTAVETKPICGPVSIAENLLSSDQLLATGSIALIPMQRESLILGVLVLMSPDENKFLPTMGLAYLEQFGKLACAALSRFRKD